MTWKINTICAKIEHEQKIIDLVGRISARWRWAQFFSSFAKSRQSQPKYLRPEQKPEREEEKKIAKYKISVILKIELSHKSIKAQSKQKLNRSFELK